MAQALKKTKVNKTTKVAAALKGAKPKPAKKTASKKTATVYKIGEGDKAPVIRLPKTSGGETALSEQKGSLVVLYFYPKDNTPGCTLEGYDFKKLHAEFKKAGAEIYGVSGDSLKSHESFKEKCGFPFDLISDEERKLCKAFDVIQMKSLYGRKFEGIERSTFVIDHSGKIAKAWRKVKVDGHAAEVLAIVKGLAR